MYWVQVETFVFVVVVLTWAGCSNSGPASTPDYTDKGMMQDINPVDSDLGFEPDSVPPVDIPSPVDSIDVDQAMDVPTDPMDDGSGPDVPQAEDLTSSPEASDEYVQVKTWIEDYKAAHPGKDGDINAKSPAQVAADPEAQQLLSICGDDQRPVIPLLAWEYGGADHAWINPEASALAYCVYTPVADPTPNWQYDAQADHVTADVYVLFPEQNPCKDKVGAEQVSACIGHNSNFEILVDAASYHDGIDAGLLLSEASTELMLILEDGSKVHLITNS